LLEDIEIFGQQYQSFKCGHFLLKELIASDTVKDFKSLDSSKEAYEFQQQGIDFVKASNYNCLIADGMGLGKTIQALLALRHNYEKLTPALVVVQSSVTYQWAKETYQWADNANLAVFPIIGTQTPILPGFSIYIISRDTLARKDYWKKLLPFKFKLVIVDEVQGFKDPNSNRSIALVNLVRETPIDHKILLSGTPIKNRANEYFTALNLISPEHFPNKARFERHWLIPNDKNIYDRLNPYRLEQFKELTSRWIIRREKSEVLKNLPEFRRNFTTVYIDDPDIKNAYNRELSLFQNFMNGAAKISSIEILGWLAKFRRLTGYAKCSFTQNYIETFLDSEPDTKLCIGVHHESVRERLAIGLQSRGYNVLTLSGKDDAGAKARIVEKFHQPENRVLIANIIAGGVGLNLQCCHDSIVMERQWNSADEEQFEARFHRDGQKFPVTTDYFNAEGTIDEFLSDIVENKRKIFGETMSVSLTSDTECLKEIVNRMLHSPLR
jgi:SNF2 family DNA or RNA helicase